MTLRDFDFEKEKREHPFPIDMFNLIIKLNSKNSLPKEELELIANLMERYLNLRANIFHDY